MRKSGSNPGGRRVNPEGLVGGEGLGVGRWAPFLTGEGVGEGG